MQTSHGIESFEEKSENREWFNSTSSSLVSRPERLFDGGQRAWLTLLGGWLTVFATFGCANAFGVFQDLYTRSHATSASNVSWVGSVQIFFIISAGLPAGKLLDAGHFRVLMAGASVLYLVSTFLLSIVQTDKFYQILLLQGFGCGLGAGLLYLPAIAVQAHHWHKYRALAMGFVSTGGAVGGMVYPILFNKFLHGSVGFAWGVRISAFVSLALLLLANLIMVSREKMLDGHNEVTMKGEKNSDHSDDSVPTLKNLLKDWPFTLANVGAFFGEAGVFFPMFYIQLFAIEKGVDKSLAFYLITIINGSSTFGRLIPCVLADHLGCLNLVAPISAICGALILAMLGVDSTASAIAFAIAYGFFSGAFLALLAPAIGSFAQHPSEIGLRLGISFFMASFGALAGTPIDGALVSRGSGAATDYPWWRAIVFSSVMCFVSAAALTIARYQQASRRGTQRV